MKFFKILLLTTLLAGPLAAEESDPSYKCDKSYDDCLEKCEKAEDGSEKCYEVCEKTYADCLALAQQNQ